MTRAPAYRMISRELSEVAPSYTVVVVGSGYGAGVAASRLARANQTVCVFERGREIPPGNYPDKLADARGSMQANTARGTIGDAAALFDLHVNPDTWALVGCGLGGTSLINANVTLEIDRRLFDANHWPRVFRDHPDALDKYYQRARMMLDSKPYPENYPKLGKLEALEKAAKSLGQPFYRPPIAVNFEDRTNPFGVAQPACTNCGDCCSGCNYGAKNTTLMNYLPDAHNHGAQIFTQAKVIRVERAGPRWRVHFEPNGEGAKGAAGSVLADHVILGAGALGSTEILLRSAEHGLQVSPTLGSRFSGNGDALGFSYDSYWKTEESLDGQGTKTLAADPIYAIGMGANDEPKKAFPGPCIAGIIDIRGLPEVREGLVIEEGVAPGILATMLPPAFFFADAMAGSFTRFGLDEVEPRLLDAKALGTSFQNNPGSIADWAYKGPVARTQTYLVMSVDDARGKLTLANDRLAIDWPDAGREKTMVRDDDWMKRAALAINGQYFPDPLWTGPLGKKTITVHPVGGCAMADDATQGVVDDACRVFSGATGTEVHRGLYVCDGAVMPGAVGVNPLLTITAVAERAVELIAEREHWKIDWAMTASGKLPPSLPSPPIAPPKMPGEHPASQSEGHGIWGALKHIVESAEEHLASPVWELLRKIEQAFEDGAIVLAKDLIKELIRLYPDMMSPQFSFTETMHGFVSLRDTTDKATRSERISTDFAKAAAWGECEGQTCAFELTIDSSDLNALVSRTNHEATISGTVTCPLVASLPMKVREGRFRLLTVDPSHAERWLMTYDMVLERPDGTCHFFGYKELEQRNHSDPWTDLTKLFIQIREGTDSTGKLLAEGILRLGPEDLMWQASSMRMEPQHGIVGKLIDHFPAARDAIAEYFAAKFAGFFAGTVFQAYGGMLATLSDFPATEAAAYEPRKLRLPNPESHYVKTRDGVMIGLTRYEGGKKGPVVLAPGFSVKAKSFATPTVDENLAETLVAHGYDVWLFDYRASGDSGNSRTRPPAFTIDDIARLDWPAAVEFIRKETGAETLQAMAHCVGSMSLLMGLGCGAVTGFRSVMASQLTLHPVTNWLNYVKSDLGMAQLLGGLSILDGVFDFTPDPANQTSNKIDVVAYQVPVPEGQECKNPTCRRVFAVYGPSYDHSKLGHDTHVALAGMFSRISTRPFDQLQLIMATGHAVAADGSNPYTSVDAARRMVLPITFLSGVNNQIFYPESGQRTRAWLSVINPDHAELYQQILFPDYAHMDLFIGRKAARDVSPTIVQELDKYN